MNSDDIKFPSKLEMARTFVQATEGLDELAPKDHPRVVNLMKGRTADLEENYVSSVTFIAKRNGTWKPPHRPGHGIWGR